ncbi:type II secretion system protein GspC [Salmonella enterica]|nr:type II secretion system protein GspC [Salmonella enterica subsp. enterica serovar Freetown]EDV9774766.1 type II secretion system protein GspC [Salmonella enterica subsp. enterica serovar Poona]EJS3009947.1 type II secretion system protein GspC [Salmonella enterica]EJS3014550.1 type II secretion system protein GspC [Salmonella enterica]
MHKKCLLKFIYYIFCIILFFIFIKIIVSVWHYVTFSAVQVEHSPVQHKERQQNARMTGNECCQLISQQNWFGEYQAVAVPEHNLSTAVVKDKLPDIVLRGVALGARPGVVLEEKGRQQFYLQGERLSSCDAVIERILPEQVMLRYQGNVIHLTLPDEEGAAEPEKKDEQPETEESFPSETSVVADTFTRLPPAVKQALAIDPQKFFEYIRFTPVYKDGVAGHTVMPGTDRSLFDISGLKAGDIAVALNGQDFTQSGATNIFMQQIYSMKIVRLTILRNGERHNISVALR